MSQYYVDPSMSDSNDGLTPSTAWATVAHATATVVDGDTCSFLGGVTHSGPLIMSGVSIATRITFNTYGIGRATIPCNGGTDWAILLINQNNVTVQGMNVVGPGLIESGTFPSATASTTSTTAGILVYATTPSTQYEGNQIIDCVVTGCYWGLLFYNTELDAAVAYRNCLIQDCQFAHNLVGGLQLAAARTDDGTRLYDNITIQHCSSFYVPGRTTGSPTAGCGFILFYCTNSVVERCWTSNNNIAGPNPASLGCAGILIAHSDNTIVRDSEADNCYAPEQIDGVGFDADLDCTNIIFERCYSHDNHGSGFYAFGSTNTIFRACISIHNTIYTPLRGNAIYTTTTTFMAFHCTFMMNGPTSTGVDLIRVETPAAGCRVLNSILIIYGGNSGGTGTAIRFGIFPSNTNILLGNSYYAFSGSTFKINVDAIDYIDVAGLRGAGYENSGSTQYAIEVDPQLNAPTNFDTRWPEPAGTLVVFDPITASPAKNVAPDLVSLFGYGQSDVGTKDFHNNPLRSGFGSQFSIGAVQPFAPPLSALIQEPVVGSSLF